MKRNENRKIFDSIADCYEPQVIPFITKTITDQNFGYRNYLITDSTAHMAHTKYNSYYDLIMFTPLLNDIKNINTVLIKMYDSLRRGGILCGRAETLDKRKKRLSQTHNGFYFRIILLYEFIFKRVLPKLFGFRYISREFRILKHHIMSKCEVLGRLRYCGFEIVDLKETDKFLYFIVSKNLKPVAEKPNQGFLIKIRKIGLHGRNIYLYKLRTMHAYADYLHDYILNNLEIDNEGKVVDDFRKTAWGRLLRKTWLDETPQIYNLLKGDVSLIGLRPLSKEFLLQYPENWRNERMKIRPGIIPPYYADCPKSFREIIESEKRYYNMKKRYPVTTDIFYFIKVLINFISGRARTG